MLLKLMLAVFCFTLWAASDDEQSPPALYVVEFDARDDVDNNNIPIALEEALGLRFMSEMEEPKRLYVFSDPHLRAPRMLLAQISSHSLVHNVYLQREFSRHVRMPFLIDQQHRHHHHRKLLSRLRRRYRKRSAVWYNSQSYVPHNRFRRWANLASISRDLLTQQNDTYYRKLFRDPFWSYQWYLMERYNGSKQDTMNIIPASLEFQSTGKGVTVAIIDNGLDWTHPDLRPNYDPYHSYDMVNDDPDPRPEDDDLDWFPKSHGTNCAGQIAMVANNSLCGVGVAPEANIAGIRLLSGPLYDFKEAKALSYKQQGIDIYSSSWGPSDDGSAIEGPGVLAREAILKGITTGRAGRGNIYVWASGNGGENGDSCAFDGYVSSPYTIAVGSVSDRLESTPFSEPCGAIMTSAISGWQDGEYSVVTTALNGECTQNHGGTSASAPFVAGAIALAIEAERRLTWRDVQHLLVQTSNAVAIKTQSNWTRNGAGHQFNPYFGFGLLDTHALIKAARQWYDGQGNMGLGERQFCQYNFLQPEHHHYQYSRRNLNPFMQYFSKLDETLFGHKQFFLDVYGCANTIFYMEHVQLQITAESAHRGFVDIDLISPMGTRVKMVYPRRNDNTISPIRNWMFTSVFFWGEKARGRWTLEIRAKNWANVDQYARLEKANLYVTGTNLQPPKVTK